MLSQNTSPGAELEQPHFWVAAMKPTYTENLVSELAAKVAQPKRYPPIAKPKRHYERLFNIVHRLGPVLVKDRQGKALAAVRRAIAQGLPLEYRRIGSGRRQLLLYLSGQEAAAQRYAVMIGLTALELDSNFLYECRHLARKARKEHHLDRRAAL